MWGVREVGRWGITDTLSRVVPSVFPPREGGDLLTLFKVRERREQYCPIRPLMMSNIFQRPVSSFYYNTYIIHDCRPAILFCLCIHDLVPCKPEYDMASFQTKCVQWNVLSGIYSLQYKDTLIVSTSQIPYLRYITTSETRAPHYFLLSQVSGLERFHCRVSIYKTDHVRCM